MASKGLSEEETIGNEEPCVDEGTNDGTSDSDDEYISKDGQDEVLLCYEKKAYNKIPAAEWIQHHLPSSIDRESSGLDWVHVARPSTADWDEYFDNIDTEGLMSAWEGIVKSARPITFKLILELAGTYNVTCGKWMFFAETGAKIDVLWQKVAMSVVEDLSAPFSSAKVSTANFSEQRHVVCIYNNDFRNRDQLLQLEQAIRKAGVKCMLLYKPNIYTYIGVYKKNPWGLRPTIAESHFDIKTGCSVITSDVMEI